MNKKILFFVSSVFLGLTLANAESNVLGILTSLPEKQIETKDAQFSIVQEGNEKRMEVEFGIKSPSPSIYFKKSGGWNLTGRSKLVIPVWNLEKESHTLWCRIESASRTSDQKISKTFRLLVEGERSDQLRIDLFPANATQTVKPEDYFGMRGTPVTGAPMYTENITEVILFLMSKSGRTNRLQFGFPSAEENSAGNRIFEKPFPFVDRFGQSLYADWPGKVRQVSDLKNAYAQESLDLQKHPTPSEWNEWGGAKNGPTYKATGFFRTQKIDGKWWFIDPSGKPFFSHGIDFVNTGSWTVVDSREKWFEALPDPSLFSNIYRTVKSTHSGYHFQGKETKAVNFFLANLTAKYSGDFREAFFSRTLTRLGSWGINTIATWSDPDITSRKKMPYTVLVSTSAPGIDGSSGHWGKFIDAFHPDFKKKFRESLQQHPSAGDPWCIGFFVDNELSWGSETSLALATLGCGPGQEAKKYFLESMKKTYGEIENLNQAWGTSLASWEQFLELPVKPDEKKAQKDLAGFTATLADTYFKGIKEVIREVAPHQLYLGCRFAWINPAAIAAAGRHCDVVSFNVYKRSPMEKGDQFKLAGDKPVIIGEFHFGALDRGLFHTGLVSVGSQAERGEAYERYLLDALKSTNIVGAHWFQYLDQPLTGRWLDGENYQVGFLDVCDNPYPETIAASRKIGAVLYKAFTAAKAP